MPSIRQILLWPTPQQVDDKAVEPVHDHKEEVGFKTRGLKVLHTVPSGDDRDQHDEDHKAEERHKAFALAQLLSLVGDAALLRLVEIRVRVKIEAVAPAVSHRAFDQREIEPRTSPSCLAARTPSSHRQFLRHRNRQPARPVRTGDQAQSQ